MVLFVYPKQTFCCGFVPAGRFVIISFCSNTLGQHRRSYCIIPLQFSLTFLSSWDHCHISLKYLFSVALTYVPPKNYEYPFESSFSASYAHMFAMMNDIVVHPAEHKFAMATQYASALQIFEWNEKDIRLLIEKDMEAPEYDMKDNSFQVNNRTKWGYLSSSGDEQFIYLLYSGAVQSQVKNPCIGNHIHVFDWDGNAIAELEVPEMLSAISVCNQKLYGIQSDDSFGYEIMEYDLKTLNLK